MAAVSAAGRPARNADATKPYQMEIFKTKKPDELQTKSSFVALKVAQLGGQRSNTRPAAAVSVRGMATSGRRVI